MRTPSLRARDRRALALGALVAVPVIGWTLVGAPIARADADRRARLASSRELLARELEIVASADAYPPLLGDARQAMREASPRLFTGGTSGARSASLVAWVQARARASEVRLSEIATVGDSASVAGLRPVSIRIAGRADLEAVLSFISSMERGEKLVRVSGLGISAREESGPEPLHFELTATGYALGDPGAHEVMAVRSGSRP